MSNIVMAKYYHTSLSYMSSIELKGEEMRRMRSASRKRVMRRISALEKKENRNLSRSEKRRILLQERRRLLNEKENEKKEKVYVLTYIR